MQQLPLIEPHVDADHVHRWTCADYVMRDGDGKVRGFCECGATRRFFASEEAFRQSMSAEARRTFTHGRAVGQRPSYRRRRGALDRGD